MRFVELWAKEIWPVIQSDYGRLLSVRPARQDTDAVGTHHGANLLDLITAERPIRNVTCNLAWTDPTGNTPLQTDISKELVEAFALDMYMSNEMLQPDPTSEDPVDAEEAGAGFREIVQRTREFAVPATVPRFYNIPIALVSRTTEPGKGEFRRLGMDVAVNGTWLAYKWAKEDENRAAQEALERLILNWPFDFYLFEAAADSAAGPEDRMFEFMVNLPVETERLRDFFGLEGKNLMMIVVKVRDLLREQKKSKATPTAKEIYERAAQRVCCVRAPGPESETHASSKSKGVRSKRFSKRFVFLYVLWFVGWAPACATCSAPRRTPPSARRAKVDDCESEVGLVPSAVGEDRQEASRKCRCGFGPLCGG